MPDQLALFTDAPDAPTEPALPNNYTDPDAVSNRSLSKRDIYGGEQRQPLTKSKGRNHSAYHSSRKYLLGR